MIKWENLNKNDCLIIRKIIKRAEKLGLTKNGFLNLGMDIEACHLSNPLKLNELLKAKDFDFVHDVCGIQGNINRETGLLENCFSPRFSKD